MMHDESKGCAFTGVGCLVSLHVAWTSVLGAEWAVLGRWIALHNLLRKYQHGVVRAD